jgi:hypothetical protein
VDGLRPRSCTCLRHGSARGDAQGRRRRSRNPAKPVHLSRFRNPAKPVHLSRFRNLAKGSPFSLTKSGAAGSPFSLTKSGAAGSPFPLTKSGAAGSPFPLTKSGEVAGGSAHERRTAVVSAGRARTPHGRGFRGARTSAARLWFASGADECAASICCTKSQIVLDGNRARCAALAAVAIQTAPCNAHAARACDVARRDDSKVISRAKAPWPASHELRNHGCRLGYGGSSLRES